MLPKIDAMKAENIQNNSLITMILLDLLIFILLVAVFYFFYRVYVHLIKNV